MNRLLTLFVLTTLTLSGCDSNTTDVVAEKADVSVNFKLLSPRNTKAYSGTISGTNGSIELEDLRVIVAEFELEAQDGSCDLATTDDDDCPEFESDAFFFELPLDAAEVTVASGLIPFGTYDSFEFEVEDLEDDPEDDDFVPSQDLLNQIRASEGFADWPDNASMIIVGSFTPDGSSTPEPFRVYAEAEVEVEMALSPPLVVDSETTDYKLNIYVSPGDWLSRPDGSVIDLREFDFESTGGQLLEFEVEFENGFKEVEIED
ncbi:MAG: hypothetical protein KJO98_00575 [Rhodothermia bacterium]|nr:hypothetical protein [Rhodothermia bacterium]